MTDEELKEFKELLYKGEVRFVYMKKDGSERKARGTMKPELLPVPKELEEKPEDKLEAGVKAGEKKIIKKRQLPADSVLYYDLDAEGFRSFKVGNLVSFEK